jgi:hypothetical protein
VFDAKGFPNLSVFFGGGYRGRVCGFFFSVILASTAMLSPSPLRAPAFPEFSYHQIDTIGAQLGQTTLADVDNDGDLDWIADQAHRRGGDIWWWEYRAPDDWVWHPLGQGNTDVGGAAHDVNGDGRVDALANWDQAGLYWNEIPDDPRRPWTQHLIAPASEHEIHGGISPRAVGDLDGDGDADVATGQAWYENLDGEGASWRQHKNNDLGERHQYGVAVRTWVGDLDGDADLDIVQAEADNPDGRVAWFENDGRGNWTRHLIKEEGEHQDFHTLAVADFDADGDLDVCSGGGPLSEAGPYKFFIWENTAGPTGTPTSERWVEYLIAREPVHEIEASDVDGDGDIDLAAKPWSVGSEHFYLQNLLIR